MEKVSYGGWENCIRLANEQMELIVTAVVGPRIIYAGLLNDENLFAEVAAHAGQIGGNEWRIYGGHRLWHAPENQPRTYYPDNAPVAVTRHEGFVRFTQSVEATTGIQKEMDIALAADAAMVTITHRLTNQTLWDVPLAPWALSVMAPGGTAVLPLPPRGSHAGNLLPANTLALWAYTDMTDPRWHWGQKYILLQQEPGNVTPQKVGAYVPDGWLAYVRNGRMFVKTFAADPQAIYPDRNANAELFVCDFMLEVETLGPLTLLPPGGAVEHVETWHLFADVPTPQNDADVEAHVRPLVESVISNR
jgi:hypothetical protein